MTSAAPDLPPAILPTSEQALAAILLWRSRHFDTLEIARLLGLPEATIARTLRAARDLDRCGPAAEVNNFNLKGPDHE